MALQAASGRTVGHHEANIGLLRNLRLQSCPGLRQNKTSAPAMLLLPGSGSGTAGFCPPPLQSEEGKEDKTNANFLAEGLCEISVTMMKHPKSVCTMNNFSTETARFS